MITADQIKDLRPIKQGEKFPIPATFYRKDEDGFHTCQITEFDLKDEEKAHILRIMTSKFMDEGRLFVRINKPFSSFV